MVTRNKPKVCLRVTIVGSRREQTMVTRSTTIVGLCPTMDKDLEIKLVILKKVKIKKNGTSFTFLY